MKQLHFRYFDTNNKKFTVTLAVNFVQKLNKNGSKKATIIFLVNQEVFGHFPTIPDHLGRFPKTTKDSRRLPSISEDYKRRPKTTEYFQGEIRKFSTIFSSLYSHAKDICLHASVKTMDFLRNTL